MQIDREPFYAGGLGAPPAIAKLVHAARDEVDILADALRQSGETASAASSLTAFIDPIDGTKEFSTGKGEQCTICIGFADADGAAVAGVVYRPLDGPSPTWALGCASEGYAREQLRPREGSDRPRGLLCSNGGRSDFLRALASQVRRARAHLQRARPDPPRTPRAHISCRGQIGGPLVPTGGAGNKALGILEGRGACYIQDRGVKRWDTCAAQVSSPVVTRAIGGSRTRPRGAQRVKSQPRSSPT